MISLKKIKTSALLILVSVLLSACGANQIALTKADKASINTVAINKIDKPIYQLSNKGSGAAAFGAIGGLIAGSEAEELANRLTAITESQKLSVNADLEERLATELKRMGYNVHFIQLKRPDKMSAFENFKTIKYSKADVILDVVVPTAGFSTEHFMMSPEWRPDIRAIVAMGKPGADKLIYSETFMYGYHNPFMSGVEIDAAKEFMLDDEAAVLKDNGKNFVLGLREAVAAIAKNIAAALSK